MKADKAKVSHDPKYSFAKLRAHTESIRREASPLLAKYLPEIEQAFSDFDEFFADIEKSKNIEANVSKLIACKFLNHLYSALILCECGLIVDAVLCERNAIEMIAFHWLILLDPSAVAEYENDNIPRPAEVRRRLKRLGADTSLIEELYAWGSKTTHVGRSSERFNLTMHSKESGTLLVGGSYCPEDQSHLLEFLPLMMRVFIGPVMI